MNNNENAVQAYKAFMWNEQNEFNCSECPGNCSGKYRGCGQQQCWVTAHQKTPNIFKITSYGGGLTITYKNGMTMDYIHSNEQYRDIATSSVDCANSWWPSLKNKETYLFKYASGTPDSSHRKEAYAAARQKLRDLGFDNSKIDWSCLLTGQDISCDGQEGVLELAADLCSGEVFGATKNSTSQTNSSEFEQLLATIGLLPLSQ